MTGMNIGQLRYGRPPMFSGYAIADTHTCSAEPGQQPGDPPTRTSSGTRLSWRCIASNISWIGNGEIRVELAVALVVGAARRLDERRSDPRTRPSRRRAPELGVWSMACPRSVRLRSLHLGRRAPSSASRRSEIIGSTRMNRKNSVDEQADRAEERHPVPARRPVHPPRRGQEVAMQAGDDDHESLEPHADVDEHRDDEQQRRRASARS